MIVVRRWVGEPRRSAPPAIKVPLGRETAALLACGPNAFLSHASAAETQGRVAGYRVDFLWRKERVVFEIDGYRFHTSRSAFDRDRRKDLALKQALHDPNRVSRDQVKHQPLLVLAHVAAALARAAVR